MGIEPIVAADFSSRRRALAAAMGAHEVVTPTTEPAIDAWRRVGGAKPVVLFEAIGVPGIIDQAMRDAPPQSRIVVVGVCMETDHLLPLVGIIKELNLQFVFGYDPMEFGDTLRRDRRGRVRRHADDHRCRGGRRGARGVRRAGESRGAGEDPRRAGRGAGHHAGLTEHRLDVSGDWDALPVDALAALLAPVDAPWWIAGGQAIDLWLGRQTRPHLDLDVQVLRRDQHRFRGRARGMGARGRARRGAHALDRW